jgi:hypothetical protein
MCDMENGANVEAQRARHTLLGATAAVLLAGYFLYFNWGGLRVHFALDDLGNIGHYYDISHWQIFLSQFLVWRGDSRPMGALFYLPIYHFAGLNPAPYQAVLLALLLANVYWVYWCAILLRSGPYAAYLAALIVSYHAGVQNLYYNAAFVFDALCGFFYFAAFVFYIRIRQRGRLLNLREKVAFLTLFLCALNSKEMAVTLPILLLFYEWFYHPPKVGNWRQIAVWIRGPGQVALIAGVLDGIDVLGKISGPNAMTSAPGYKPLFTIERIYDFQKNLLQDFFLSWYWLPGWAVILAIWAAFALYVWWRKDRPALRLLFWFLMVAPLPIEFLPGKRQACFCLLLMGAAIAVGVIVVDTASMIAQAVARVGRFRPGIRQVLATAMVLAGVIWWVREQNHLRRDIVQNQMDQIGYDTWDLIQQFPKFSRPRPGSRVAFLASPLGTVDSFFLAELWFHDKSVYLHVSGQGPLTPEELAKMDYLYTYENRRLVQVK